MSTLNNSKQLRLDAEPISFRCEGLSKDEVENTLKVLLKSFGTISVIIRKHEGDTTE